MGVPDMKVYAFVNSYQGDLVCVCVQVSGN